MPLREEHLQRLTDEVFALRRECVKKDRLRFAPLADTLETRELQAALDEKLKLAVCACVCHWTDELGCPVLCIRDG